MFGSKMMSAESRPREQLERARQMRSFSLDFDLWPVECHHDDGPVPRTNRASRIRFAVLEADRVDNPFP
jgi:hypothetical protein